MIKRHPILTALLTLPPARSATLPILREADQVRGIAGGSEDALGVWRGDDDVVQEIGQKIAASGDDDPASVLAKLAHEAINRDEKLAYRSRKAIERCFNLRPIPSPRPPLGF